MSTRRTPLHRAIAYTRLDGSDLADRERRLFSGGQETCGPGASHPAATSEEGLSRDLLFSAKGPAHLQKAPAPSRKFRSDGTIPLYQGTVVKLGLETAVLPDGRSLELEVVRHPGGAAAVAVDRAQQVCLLRQYRHAGGGWLWELPAGKLDPGESPLATAQRELEEEAGLCARRWEPLGSILPTPGFCDERVHLYLARELETVMPRPGVHEVIEVHWVALADALAQAQDGRLEDAKTLVGLFRAAARLAAETP